MRPRDRFIVFTLVIFVGSVLGTFIQDEADVIIDDVDSIARVRPFENRLVMRLNTENRCDYLFAFCYKQSGSGENEGVCPVGFCEISISARKKRILTAKGIRQTFNSPFIEVEITPTGLEVYRGDVNTYQYPVTISSCVPQYDEHGYIAISVPFFHGNCSITLPKTTLDQAKGAIPYIEWIFIEIVVIAAAILIISTAVCLIRSRAKPKQESSSMSIKEFVRDVPMQSLSKIRAKNLESKKNQQNIEKIVTSSQKSRSSRTSSSKKQPISSPSSKKQPTSSPSSKKQQPSSQSAPSSGFAEIAEVKPRGATSGKIAKTPKKQSRVTLSKSSEKMPRKALSPFKKHYY